MNKTILLLILFQVLPLQAQQQEAECKLLPDLFKPRYIGVDKQRVYIVNNTKQVVGYGVQNFEKSFELNPRTGVGPAEFVNVPMVMVENGEVILKTTEKIAFYSSAGKYLREKRLKQESVIRPLGKNYLLFYYKVSKSGEDIFNMVDILDENLKTIRNVSQRKLDRTKKGTMIITGGTRRGRYELIRPSGVLAVWNNQIFIGDQSAGFVIEVFDQTGDPMRKMTLNIPRVAVTEKDRQRLIQKAKDEWGSEESWKAMLKSNDLITPEYFPYFDKVVVVNDRIYVKTFTSRENRYEFIILDLMGKEQTRVFLPASDYWTILDNRYYYLSYDDGEDEWSLCRTFVYPAK